MNRDIGSQLGNYRLLRLLGTGGFADVYLGEHIYLQRVAAIKVLRGRMTREESGSFLQEARTVTRLEHPHIIHVLDFGVEDDIPYLIMDYAPGNLRAKHPRGTQVPLSIVIQYISQIASALQYAHDNQVIHRDVKPENMLLGQNHEVLLSDFGIASAIQNTTQSQDIAGTAYYMAPEQFRGKVTFASDQYSLAIVVYQWLCGHYPFMGPMFEIFNMHMTIPPPSLCIQVPALSPLVESVVMTALAKDPSQRFHTIQQFATNLAAAANDTAQQLSNPTMQPHGGFMFPLSGATVAEAPATFSVEGERSSALEKLSPSPQQLPTIAIALPSSLPSAHAEICEEAPSLLLPSLFSSFQEPVQASATEIVEQASPLPILPSPSSFLLREDVLQSVPEEQVQDPTIIASLLTEPSNEQSISLLLPSISSFLQSAELTAHATIQPDVATTIRIVQPIPYKFFISYHENNRHWAEWIQWHLKQNGYVVLLPERNNQPVTNMVLEMQEAMLLADYFIVVLSHHYLTTYSNQYNSFVSLKNRPGRVLPVRIEEGKYHPIMSFFNTPAYIDLVGLDALVAGKKLVEDIHALMAPFFPGPDKGTWVKPAVSQLKVFLSYAHEDKAHREQLQKYLKALSKLYPTMSWHDGEIVAGEDFAQAIEKHLSSAHIILLLLSQDFIASDYCYYKEMKKAMERHEADKARVIPIILRSCMWKETPIGKLQALPSEGKPINTWLDKDEAFLDVARGIKKALEEMLRNIS